MLTGFFQEVRCIEAMGDLACDMAMSKAQLAAAANPKGRLGGLAFKTFFGGCWLLPYLIGKMKFV